VPRKWSPAQQRTYFNRRIQIHRSRIEKYRAMASPTLIAIEEKLLSQTLERARQSRAQETQKK